MRNRWQGETVAILASGPSLTFDDVEYARAHSDRVIAINETWRACPTADVLYAADARWWVKRRPTPDAFTGERWTTPLHYDTPEARAVLATLQQVETRRGHDVSLTPPIATGSNSSFQAMGLALWWGARRIVFLGLDMQFTRGQTHWHGDHTGGLANPASASLLEFARAFDTAAPQIAALGVEVINASRETALTCFKREELSVALP